MFFQRKTILWPIIANKLWKPEPVYGWASWICKIQTRAVMGLSPRAHVPHLLSPEPFYFKAMDDIPSSTCAIWWNCAWSVFNVPVVAGIFVCSTSTRWTTDIEDDSSGQFANSHLVRHQKKPMIFNFTFGWLISELELLSESVGVMEVAAGCVGWSPSY